MPPHGCEAVENALRLYLEDLSWHPTDETLGLKRLYAQISVCLKEVLKCTLGNSDCKKRVWAFNLVEGMSRSHPEAACLVAKFGLFGEALERNLQLQDPCQQETVFCAVSLALAVASQVPESSVFQDCMSTFVAIASDTWCHQPFRALQILATHVLIHLCHSRVSRQWVRDMLTLDKVQRLLETARRGDCDGQCVPEHTFAASLLLANLCELRIAVVGTDAENSGTFGYLADDLWHEDDFFVAMAACIAASARKEPWPPSSSTRWMPWKLAQTAERLARFGYAAELRGSVVPLATLLAQSCSGKVAVQPERTGRLSIEAIRSITSAAGNVDQMRGDVRAALGTSFEKCLQDLREEQPAADDLISIFCAGQDPQPYLHVDLT